MEADGEGLSLLRPATGSDRVVGMSPFFSAAESWINTYFSGSRNFPELPPLSLKGTDFRLSVWNLLLDIPYGKTVTYGEIARSIDCASARAVGGAVGANPIMIMIPCHRVISFCGIGGYAYGIELKRSLLTLENDSNY